MHYGLLFLTLVVALAFVIGYHGIKAMFPSYEDLNDGE